MRRSADIISISGQQADHSVEQETHLIPVRALSHLDP